MTPLPVGMNFEDWGGDDKRRFSYFFDSFTQNGFYFPQLSQKIPLNFELEKGGNYFSRQCAVYTPGSNYTTHLI